VSIDGRIYDPNRPMTIIHSLDEIPAFTSEAEEAAFWATHEFSDELWHALPQVPEDELPPVWDNAVPEHEPA
jgi:hypothetical protein